MFRSLHMKLVMIMLLLVTSLMAVVGAFLMTSITNFYIDDFYEQMSEVFGESNAAFVCFAPYDKPEIAMATAPEHGGSGSDVAGSVAAQLLEQAQS